MLGTSYALPPVICILIICVRVNILMYEMKIFSMFYYVIETKQILYISNFNHKLYPITFRCTFVTPIAFLADVNISRPKINSLNLNLSSTASITTYDAVLLFGIYQQKLSALVKPQVKSFSLLL